MTSLANWLTQHKQQLKRIDLELLLCEALKKERSWLFAHDDAVLTDKQSAWLNQAVAQAKNGKPIAYITGHKAFWTLKLAVNEHTLIPRPETELIIDLSLQLPEAPTQILDLGTGSGAIALALASEFPLAHVLACDLSPNALSMAKNNSEANNITNVSWLESFWMEQVDPEMSFDLIVSNPPYIDPDDPHLLNLTYEPRSALVAENQGMSDIIHIINNAMAYLKPNGHLLIEHGWNQGDEVRDLLSESGYIDVQTHQDLAGKDRVSSAIKPHAQ